MKHQCERETSISCLLYTLNLGSNPQPFGGRDSSPTNWATWSGRFQFSWLLLLRTVNSNYIDTFGPLKIMLAEINYAIVESCFIVIIFLFYVMNSFITAFIFEIPPFQFYLYFFYYPFFSWVRCFCSSFLRFLVFMLKITFLKYFNWILQIILLVLSRHKNGNTYFITF